MENKEITFEEAMDKLESIIMKLEEGDVPLEKALSLYQKGMELSGFCHTLLSQAEEQLAKLITDDGEKEFSIDEGE
ncbi:exodeoxyribonuclease VII small subunit [Pseudobacillus wudalianchiensis]|uniref:Exodeoxyribonuclease 7 small subunit n=1 Tax=Pseudobacillus wudalianchiensis TaxID=1743143 RepID=A0A1B9B986_9BACI|nr:exodeoxyribonuclease VII small subunit [Bacillus wudalianchiensis]OCA92648.1 exodeoxyribonuclease VII small subunit [Bacillus wudalianchiensis]